MTRRYVRGRTTISNPYRIKPRKANTVRKAKKAVLRKYQRTRPSPRTKPRRPFTKKR